MMPSLIRRTIVPNQAYAALDLDSPGALTLAVAWKGEDGWHVAVDDGRTVAAGLTQTRALNLMHHAAADQANRSAVRSLLAEVRR